MDHDTEVRIEDALDNIVLPSSSLTFEEMQRELESPLASKRPASGLSPPEGATRKSKRNTSAPPSSGQGAAPVGSQRSRGRGGRGGVRGGSGKAPARGSVMSSMSETYPRDVPSADAMSQRAFDELSETSSVTHQLLEEEIEKNKMTQARLEELYRSHNKLATDHSELKSLVLRLSEGPPTEKRGTSITPAREVLKTVSSSHSTGQEDGHTKMLPPTLPTAQSSAPLATGGRPRNKPT